MKSRIALVAALFAVSLSAAAADVKPGVEPVPGARPFGKAEIQTPTDTANETGGYFQGRNAKEGTPVDAKTPK
jgi:hypothetical protein